MARRKKKTTKKRKWDSSNPLYRYLHSKKKTTRKRSVSTMARRKKVYRRRSSSSSNLMKGFFKPTGVIGMAIAGLGAASLAQKFLPNVLPMQDKLVAFAVGGIPAAAAQLFLSGNSSMSTSGSMWD